METSPSAVPAKRSAQGEGREDEEKEEEEEEAAGSSAKRMRREENHMTGEGFSNHALTCVSTLIMPCHSLTSSWSTLTVLGVHLLDRFMCVFRRLVWWCVHQNVVSKWSTSHCRCITEWNWVRD